MTYRFSLAMLCLALDVLTAAAYRHSREAIDTAQTRLALRVVTAFLGKHPAVLAYWQLAQVRDPPPYDRCHRHVAAIIKALVALGWDVADDQVPGYVWVMCNRYRMTANQAGLAARYGIVAPYPEDATYPPPELFPKSRAYVVSLDRFDPGRRWREVTWGMPRTLIGAKGQPIEQRVTNVRNLDSPFWRSTLANREFRCLVPVTAFSEYGPGEKGKRPLFWFDVPSRPIFSFAGVWRPVGKEIAFAFLTTAPNAIVAPIHPQAMPVILHEEDEERWLEDGALDLVAPYPSQLMRVLRSSDSSGVLRPTGSAPARRCRQSVLRR